MPPANVIWTYYDNRHPSQVLENLKRFIRNRQSIEPDTLEYWYVGQTDSPEDRLLQHQNDCAARGDHLWTDMFVVYGHRDLGFVTDMENALIKYLRGRAERRGEEKRRLNSAGERYDGRQIYSVYVLHDDHPNSASGAKEQFRKADPCKDRSHFYEEKNKVGDPAARERIVVEKFEQAIRINHGGYRRRVNYFYVGFTNQPERRYAEHQSKMTNEYGGNLWEGMRIVYQTPSLQNALMVETILIDHALKSYRDRCHNTTRGRFARIRDEDEFPYFYVYYLEDRR